jgi:6-phosphogluconolactonase
VQSPLVPSFRFPGFLLSLCLLSIATGCGSNARPKAAVLPPSSGSEFLYKNNGTGILAYSVDPSSGQLGSGPITTQPPGWNASLISDSAGKFLFVFNQPETSILAYSIDSSTGVLTAISGSPFLTIGTGAGSLVMSPTAGFLYAATTAGVEAFAVDATTGGLTPISGSPFSAGTAFLSVTVDPSGQFLYAISSPTIAHSYQDLFAFSIDAADGAITSIPPSPWASFSVGLNSGDHVFLVVNPAGTFLYVIAGDPDAPPGIAVFPIDGSTGALGGVSVSGGSQGDFSLVFDPTGKFIYVSSSWYVTGIMETVSSIGGYEVDPSSGLLNSIVGGYSLKLQPVGFNVVVDPSGNLFVSQPPSLTAYRIGSTGELSQSAGIIVPQGVPGTLAVVRTR